MAILDDSDGAGRRRTSASARLDVRGLTWVAGGRTIVAGVDLTVEPGEMVGVIGPNGSGKSSLLRCIYRHHRPTGGSARLAAVPQEFPAEFGLTVEEIVAMGRTPHRRGFAGDGAPAIVPPSTSRSMRSISRRCALAPSTGCRAARSSAR